MHCHQCVVVCERLNADRGPERCSTNALSEEMSGNEQLSRGCRLGVGEKHCVFLFFADLDKNELFLTLTGKKDTAEELIQLILDLYESFSSFSLIKCEQQHEPSDVFGATMW